MVDLLREIYDEHIEEMNMKFSYDSRANSATRLRCVNVNFGLFAKIRHEDETRRKSTITKRRFVAEIAPFKH